MSGNTRARWRPFGLALLLAFALAGGAVAQDRGQVTNLPMPRYVSLKAAEGNVRRGPSLSPRIDWVFTKRNMPHAEAGVIARRGACTLDWCRISAGGQRGWVPKATLWGVKPEEIRD